MTNSRLPALLLVAAMVSACGGNEPKEVDCNANLKFQNRVEGKRVVAPEGLDQLNELAEMPIPRADPNAPKLPEGVCNDQPPVISAGS
jgi:hypothetical protein